MLHKKEKLPLLKMLEKEVEKRKKHNKEGDKLLGKSYLKIFVPNPCKKENDILLHEKEVKLKLSQSLKK